MTDTTIVVRDPITTTVNSPGMTTVIKDDRVSTVVMSNPNVVVVQLATGPQGPIGPVGLPGATQHRNHFVQNAAPVVDPSITQYAWWQTNLGLSGEDITLWIEDGDA